MKRFDLVRHSSIKNQLNQQLTKAASDARLISLAKRYMLLAKRLQAMNAKNGFISKVDLNVIPEDQLTKIKTYRTKLLTAGK